MALNRIERRRRIHYRIRKHVASNDKGLAAECKGKNGIDAAAIVGKAVAQRAIEKGITTVSFDRGGYLYHGRVKSLADAAREGGLVF